MRTGAAPPTTTPPTSTALVSRRVISGTFTLNIVPKHRYRATALTFADNEATICGDQPRP
jgi:hypothetical protein